MVRVRSLRVQLVGAMVLPLSCDVTVDKLLPLSGSQFRSASPLAVQSHLPEAHAVLVTPHLLTFLQGFLPLSLLGKLLFITQNPSYYLSAAFLGVFHQSLQALYFLLTLGLGW